MWLRCVFIKERMKDSGEKNCNLFDFLGFINVWKRFNYLNLLRPFCDMIFFLYSYFQIQYHAIQTWSKKSAD